MKEVTFGNLKIGQVFRARGIAFHLTKIKLEYVEGDRVRVNVACGRFGKGRLFFADDEKVVVQG